eukprot:TRINITY_DN104652_c0_g1_i1.p1 TRINITY_DN104652_c0_g1~~TRINITY_DN104652_c0_g1_i1.p1  ORF type:complete len:424 (+),score=80.17 TRINITY_DN104652_c0_g1_i1:165-1436(+)
MNTSRPTRRAAVMAATSVAVASFASSSGSQPATSFVPAPARLSLLQRQHCVGGRSSVAAGSTAAPMSQAAATSLAAVAAAGSFAVNSQRQRVGRLAESSSASTDGSAASASSSVRATDSASVDGGAASEAVPATPVGEAEGSKKRKSAAESRLALEQSVSSKGYENLTAEQRGAVSGFFFPDEEELDMDKSMPLEDHLSELRDGVLRAAAFAVVSVGVCLAFYRELTTALEGPAQWSNMGVKFVQLAPGEFFFVSVKVAIAVGLLIAFPYALFEAALYFTPALTRSERNTVGPTVLASAVLFYSGAAFAYFVLSPAALGFFLGYSQDVIESQFSIDQYFEFILSMGFATGIAFQVPVLQVALGLLGVLASEGLFSVWRYVIVGSAVVGAILTPSTDPITQLLLSGALCALYFAGAGVLYALGR